MGHDGAQLARARLPSATLLAGVSRNDKGGGAFLPLFLTGKVVSGQVERLESAEVPHRRLERPCSGRREGEGDGGDGTREQAREGQERRPPQLYDQVRPSGLLLVGCSGKVR